MLRRPRSSVSPSMDRASPGRSRPSCTSRALTPACNSSMASIRSPTVSPETANGPLAVGEATQRGGYVYVGHGARRLGHGVFGDGLLHSRRRHRQVAHPYPYGVVDRVGDRRRRRRYRHFTHAAHSVGMSGVRHLGDDRVDHREVQCRRHPVVEQACVAEPPLGVVEILLVERPTYPLHDPAL